MLICRRLFSQVVNSIAFFLYRSIHVIIQLSSVSLVCPWRSIPSSNSLRSSFLFLFCFWLGFAQYPFILWPACFFVHTDSDLRNPLSFMYSTFNLKHRTFSIRVFGALSFALAVSFTNFLSSFYEKISISKVPSIWAVPLFFFVWVKDYLCHVSNDFDIADGINHRLIARIIRV